MPLAEFGRRSDVLVNNAGIAPMSPEIPRIPRRWGTQCSTSTSRAHSAQQLVGNPDGDAGGGAAQQHSTAGTFKRTGEIVPTRRQGRINVMTEAIWRTHSADRAGQRHRARDFSATISKAWDMEQSPATPRAFACVRCEVDEICGRPLTSPRAASYTRRSAAGRRRLC